MRVTSYVPPQRTRMNRNSGSNARHSTSTVANASARSSSNGPVRPQATKIATNPLFTENSPYDEFPLTTRNVRFAQQQFGLDSAIVNLVNQNQPGLELSVVYHSGPNGLEVDAYRAVKKAAKDSVYTVYQAKNDQFDPRGHYRNEIFTPLGEGRFFGSVLSSKQVVVPEIADPGFKEQLRQAEFELGGTQTVDQSGASQDFKNLFGLDGAMNLEMYSLKEKSFVDKFKVFSDLFMEDAQYRSLKIGDAIGDVGAALLLGVITPKLWEQGAAYGIAGTISSIGNIGSPIIGIAGESFLGSVVDNAVNSEKPMENLKKVGLWTAGLSTLTAAGYFALHPDVVQSLPFKPGHSFLGLYGMSTLTSGISGVMSGKANFAIHDQIINKGAHSKPEYSKNFFQIMGVESSISRAIYLGSYTGTVAASAAFPQSSVYMAGAGAALWAGSNFLFPLHKDRPKMEVTIEGGAFINDQGTYKFDSGWEVSLEGGQGKLVKEDEEHYSLTFEEGQVRVKNPEAMTTDHTRRLKDYLPVKARFLGEKEVWTLDDGDESLKMARYGTGDYELETISDNEVLLKTAD